MNLTLVNQYPTEVEASIDAGMLRSNGIEAQVRTNGLSGLFPGTTVGGAAIYVSEDQAEKAQQLLEQHGDE